MIGMRRDHGCESVIVEVWCTCKDDYYHCDLNYLKSLFLVEPFLSVPLPPLENKLSLPFSF